MNVIERLTFFLYEGFRPVPVFIIFILVYPRLWVRRDQLRKSFNFLSVFSIYILFIIPGFIFVSFHEDGLFHRFNENMAHEAILTDTQVLNNYRETINELGYFEYDDCQVFNVKKDFKYNNYSLICSNEKDEKYILFFRQNKRNKNLKITLDFVFQEGTRFHDYPLFGVDVETYLALNQKIGDSGEFDMQDSMSQYEVVFNKDLDYNEVTYKDVLFNQKPDRNATFYLKVIGLRSSYFVYLP